MTRLLLVGAAACAVLLAAVGSRLVGGGAAETLVVSQARPPQAAPLCPWREPEADLQALFPTATRHEVQTCILSGQRLELAQRLGRAPTGDENALHIHRVYAGTSALGAVLTRRVKGTHGAIELVLGVDAEARICGLRLQRLREPEPIARALENPDWLRAFHGRRADSAWDPGRDIPEVPAEARDSAAAVVAGARSLLILLAAANETGASDSAPPSSH